MGNNCCQSAGPADNDVRDRAEDVTMSEDSPILHTGDVRMPVAAQSAKSAGSRSNAKQEEDRKVQLNADVETIVLPGEELQDGRKRDSEVATRPPDAADAAGAEANVGTGSEEPEDGVTFKPSRNGEDDGPATFAPVIAPSPGKRRGRKPTGVVTKAMLAAALEEEGEEDEEGGGSNKGAKKDDSGSPGRTAAGKQEDGQVAVAAPAAAPEDEVTASIPLHLQPKGRRKVTAYMTDFKIMRVLKFFGE